MIDNRGSDHMDACHLSAEEKKKIWAERQSRRTKAAS